MPSLASLLRLEPRDRRTALGAAVLLPTCAVAIRALGYRRSQEMLARLAPEPPAKPAQEAVARSRAVAGVVGAVARRGVPQVSCLPRSLALWFLLRRQGIDSVIRIGVRRPGASLQAHAWVEVCGVSLDDRPEGHDGFAAMQPARGPAGK